MKCHNPTPPFFCSWKNVWSKVRACPSPHQPAGELWVEERQESRVSVVQNTLLSRYGILISGCRWRGEVERLYGLYQFRIILKKSFLGGCKTSKKSQICRVICHFWSLKRQSTCFRQFRRGRIATFHNSPTSLKIYTEVH